LRSALTALGIIIGVSAVIALTAVGSGTTSSIKSSLEGLGTNLLTISNNFARRGGGGGLVRFGSSQTITLEDAQAIQALNDPRIAGIAPVVQGNQQLKHGANNISAAVIGTWPDYATVRNSAPAQGAFFNQQDLEDGALVAVLGYDIAQQLFPGASPLGQTVELAGVSFTIIGALPDKGSSFGSGGSDVLIPLTTYLQRVGRASALPPTHVSSIAIKAANPADLTPVQNELTNLLAQRHDTPNPSDYGFRIQNQADQLEALNSVSQTLSLFLGGVAGISLLVGGIGIMNIMLVSVTERTREIGVRKALGAKPRDILTQFLVEAILLSLGGGLLGVLIGVGAAQVLGGALKLTPVITGSSVLISVVFALAVGVFFGFYPAQRAARLDPVESLRYE
jgi:putative ABC transport system permease protein